MVDAASIETRLQRLGELLRALDEIASLGRQNYDEDMRTQLAAQHALQQAIQICVDIGAHVITELGLATPQDYRSVFHELRSAGLDPELADRLAEATGMRNILVHGYLDVDDDIVWAALFELDDLYKFTSEIKRLLESEQ